MADCKECLHNGVCYLQEVSVDIERVLKDFGCDDYKPSADVVEVRYGEWIYQGYGCWGCTACRTNTDFNTVFDPLKDLGLCYCPHCGAKMDGKGEGECREC